MFSVGEDSELTSVADTSSTAIISDAGEGDGVGARKNFDGCEIARRVSREVGSFMPALFHTYSSRNYEKGSSKDFSLVFCQLFQIHWDVRVRMRN